MLEAHMSWLLPVSVPPNTEIGGGNLQPYWPIHPCQGFIPDIIVPRLQLLAARSPNSIVPKQLLFRLLHGYPTDSEVLQPAW